MEEQAGIAGTGAGKIVRREINAELDQAVHTVVSGFTPRQIPCSRILPTSLPEHIRRMDTKPRYELLIPMAMHAQA